MPFTPVPIDRPREAQQAAESAAGYFGAFVFENRLYSVCSVTRGGDHVGMYQSLDLGRSWNELDPAFAPLATSDNGTAIVHGSIVTVAWNNAGSVNLTDFDLSAGGWDSPYGVAGAPLADFVHTVYLRPDGSLVVIYERNTHPTDSGLYASFYASGAWGVEIDLGVNVEALPGYDPTQININGGDVVSVMGPDGSVYVFFTVQSFISSPMWNNRSFYQRISPANSAPSGSGNFLDFPGQDTSGIQDLGAAPFGKPCIAGNNIVLPIARNNPALVFPAAYAALYIGVGLPLPSWSEVVAPIDLAKGSVHFASCSQIGAASYNGAVLCVGYLWYGLGGFSNSAWRLCRTASPLSGPLVWSCETVFDANDSAFPNPDLIETLSYPSVNQVGQYVLLTVDGEGSVPSNFECELYLGEWRPAPGVSGSSGGGTGAPKACCCVPDVPGLEEVRKARAEARGALWPFPWRTAPPAAEHVFRRGALPAPVSSARTVLLSYRIPTTMRFVLDGVVLWYSGVYANWVPGDGAIAFSLTVNNALGVVDASQGMAFKDYGRVIVPLGSPFSGNGAWSIESGEQSMLDSGQTLTASVVVDPLQITGGQFIAIFRGWLFPQ